MKVKGILDSKQDGSRLTTLEVHDIMCHIADSVLAGGIRRAALISLFSMMTLICYHVSRAVGGS